MKKTEFEIKRMNTTPKKFWEVVSKKCKKMDVSILDYYEDWISPAKEEKRTVCYPDYIYSYHTMPFDYLCESTNSYKMVLKFNFDGPEKGMGSGYAYYCEYDTKSEWTMEDVVRQAKATIDYAVSAIDHMDSMIKYSAPTSDISQYESNKVVFANMIKAACSIANLDPDDYYDIDISYDLSFTLD